MTRRAYIAPGLMMLTPRILQAARSWLQQLLLHLAQHLACLYPPRVKEWARGQTGSALDQITPRSCSSCSFSSFSPSISRAASCWPRSVRSSATACDASAWVGTGGCECMGRHRAWVGTWLQRRHGHATPQPSRTRMSCAARLRGERHTVARRCSRLQVRPQVSPAGAVARRCSRPQVSPAGAVARRKGGSRADERASARQTFAPRLIAQAARTGSAPRLCIRI